MLVSGIQWSDSYIYVCVCVCVCVCVLYMLTCFSLVWLFETLWTVTRQAPLLFGFSRQECWSELPGPPPGDLPDPEMEPASPTLAGEFFTSVPQQIHIYRNIYIYRYDIFVGFPSGSGCKEPTEVTKHICTSIYTELFQILFPYRLLWNTE